VTSSSSSQAVSRIPDAPGRTQREVVDLLLAARRTIDLQREMCRAEQAVQASAKGAPTAG
jgi:hypothetical protein